MEERSNALEMGKVLGDSVMQSERQTRGGAHPRNKRGLKEYLLNGQWIHPDAQGELKVEIESTVKKHKN
jgi:hypothetical protein